MRLVVKELPSDRPGDKQHRDHELSGKFQGVRECHIEPDWLLIYDKEGNTKSGTLKLIRTGTHGDLLQWLSASGISIHSAHAHGGGLFNGPP